MKASKGEGNVIAIEALEDNYIDTSKEDIENWEKKLCTLKKLEIVDSEINNENKNQGKKDKMRRILGIAITAV